MPSSQPDHQHVLRTGQTSLKQYFRVAAPHDQHITEFLHDSPLRRDVWLEFTRIRDSKPGDKWRELDQFAAREESVFAELEYMLPEISSRTVVFLGGNDGMPILIDILDRSGLLPHPPKKMIVVEYDAGLVKWLRDNIKHKDYRFRCYHQDMRKPLPRAIVSLNDAVVFSDPPFNCPGEFLWCQRASQILAVGGHFYLCVPNGVPWTACLDPYVTEKCIEFGFTLTGKMQMPVKYSKYGAVTSNLWHWVKVRDSYVKNAQFDYDVHASCKSGNDWCKHNRGPNEMAECQRLRMQWVESMVPEPSDETKRKYAGQNIA